MAARPRVYTSLLRRVTCRGLGQNQTWPVNCLAVAVDHCFTMAYRTSQYVLFGKPGIGRDSFTPPSFYAGVEDDSDVTPCLAPNDRGERPARCSLSLAPKPTSCHWAGSNVPGGLRASTRLLCQQCVVWSGSALAYLGPEEG